MNFARLVSGVLSLSVSLIASNGLAAEQAKKQSEKTSPTVASEPAAPKKARPIPFHGKLASFSAPAKTITVGKRTFQLTAETKLYKGDKKTPGSLNDAKVGAPVTGSYIKAADGKLMARSVYFKPMGSETPSGSADSDTKEE